MALQTFGRLNPPTVGTGAERFLPDCLTPAVVRVCRVLNRALLLRFLNLHVDLAAEDLARLQALPPDRPIIIAANHPSFSDPLVLWEVMSRWGRMPAWVTSRAIFRRGGGLLAPLLRYNGCFSVSPGAGNATAVGYALDLLRGGRPVVIFPEGHPFYLNDVILPLRHGVAEWALKLAGEGLDALIVPLVMKYQYGPQLGPALDGMVARMEREMQLDPRDVPQGDFWSRLYVRLYRLGDHVVSGYEARYGLLARPGQDVEERVHEMAHTLVRGLEQRWMGGEQSGDLFARARHLMTLLEPQDRRDAAKARFAWALATFYSGYLTPDSPPSRFAETVMKYQRELLDRVPLSLRIPHHAAVQVGEPLHARDWLASGATPLLHEVASAMQALLTPPASGRSA